ncbi:MAG: hypothetical protein JXR96_24160 [Deltaproteobacteria bacterium]|nr:hypothetical protein [Deltaproteobacteria bacterium]
MNPEASTAHLGMGSLVLMAGLLVFGGLALGLFWQAGAAAGWMAAGLLGLCAWWTARLAFRASPRAFFKLVFGGMLLRMCLLGIAAVLVLSFGWLDRIGFVAGLAAGVLVFLGLEIGVLNAAGRRSKALKGES